jgi:hypothetical protein
MFYFADEATENGEGRGEPSRRFSRDVTAEELRGAEEYLSSYRHGARMLSCMRYGRLYMGERELPDDPLLSVCENEDGFGSGDEVDESLIRARMFSVRQFVNSLCCDSNARTLLYWHYIRGVSVTKCADMLDMSRASAFRVRKRALESAARALRRQKLDMERLFKTGV